ncbi:MAG: hypothetical protein K2X72_12560 [Reyranella sp.]|nr:hypothetical protein [Reyranella sp.]
MTLLRALLSAGALVALGACDTVQGMTETVTTSGPVTVDAANRTICAASQRPDQFGLFQVAYACAWTKANQVAAGTLSVTEPDVQQSYRVLLREGLGLVRGNCADFFRKRGDSQQNISLSRDVVAMGGAAAAAIVGLSGGGALALSIIAVSSATLYSGLDTYTRNFLFGVDNIESVRTLTMKTLNDNTAELLTASRTETLAFPDVTGAIMDNQEICKPASIAAAVRIKLRRGVEGFDPAPTGGGTALSDRAVVARISELTGLLPGVLMNDGQLALVCWATTAEGSTKQDTINKLLGDNFKNRPGTPGWPGVSTSVGYACQQQLSDAKQALLDQKIKQFQESGGSPGPQANAVRAFGSQGALSGAGLSGTLRRSDGTAGPLFAPMTVR